MLTSQTQTRLKKPGLTSFNCVCQQKTDYCGGDQVGRLGCKPESSDVCVCVCVTEQGSLGARGKVSRCVNTQTHTPHSTSYRCLRFPLDPDGFIAGISKASKI